MFTVEKTAPDRIFVEVGGKITADEMSEGLDAMLPMLREMEDAGMLMIYHDIGLPEVGAVMEELKRLPQMFGVMGRVNKVALISSQKWVRDMAELEGLVLPGTTIRGFSPEARPAAEAFLGNGDDEDAEGDFENFPV